MIVNPVKISGATVATAYSGNTPYLEGKITTVRCKFATNTTTFDFTINDSDGIPIFERVNETHKFVKEVALAVRGTYTIVIANASKNEAFTVKMELEE